MIKNQKQAGNTIRKIEELGKTLLEFKTNHSDKESPEYKLGTVSLEGLISELKAQVDEYESRINGNFNILHCKSLKDLPHTLIAARLSQNISQKKLAEMIGIKEQQIQRYELEDYESASFTRILEVAAALGIKFYFDKIIIIKQDNADATNFQIPDEISADQIQNVKNRINNNRCILIE